MAPIKTAATRPSASSKASEPSGVIETETAVAAKLHRAAVIFYLAICNIARRVLCPGGFFFDEFTFAYIQKF
jgi:hypothetical protein